MLVCVTWLELGATEKSRKCDDPCTKSRSVYSGPESLDLDLRNPMQVRIAHSLVLGLIHLGPGLTRITASDAPHSQCVTAREQRKMQRKAAKPS